MPRQAAGVLALCSAWLLSAATVSAVTLEAFEDNFVMSGANAETVQGSAGTSTTLAIAARGGNFNRKTYLHFDLTSQAGTAGEILSAGEVRFTISSLIGPGSGDVIFNFYGITDAADTWTESTVTWNNAPKNATASAGGVVATGTTLLGSVTVDTSGTVTDVQHTLAGSAVTDYLNWAAGKSGDFYGTGATSDLTPTVIVTSAGGINDAGINIFSEEGGSTATQYPQVRYEVVPEPATGLLLAGAAGWLVARRRRSSSR